MSVTIQATAPGVAFKSGLWLAQFLLAAVFIFAGFTKLTTPIPELAKIMPWTGAYPLMFVRGIALVDLAGGIGLLLPALTRIRPGLTVLAALGCAVLQVLAILFHFSRGEAAATPLNAVLLGLALLVYWGRARKAPILPRA